MISLVLRYIRTCTLLMLCFDMVGAFIVEKHPAVTAPERKSGRLEHCRQRRPSASNGSRGRDSFSLCGLFFRPSSVEKSSFSWKVPRSTINELVTSNKSLPWRVELEKSSETKSLSGAAPILTLRTIWLEDVATITEMCVSEYGSGPTSFPFNSPLLIGDWLDREGLRLLVDLTTRLKVARQPRDHALIVGTVNDRIIGVVEVSLQPVIPDRNPPPFPIPLFWKRVFALISGNIVQGWITNLLVLPEFRGRGYSKVLVAACEAVAASWQCTSIHLHCDSDRTAGEIAQKLYAGMGYKTLHDEKFSWIGATSSIFFVEGVRLLYLHKNLKHHCECQ